MVPRFSFATVLLSLLTLHGSVAYSQVAGGDVEVRLFENRAVTSAVVVAVDGPVALYAQLDREPLATVASGDSVTIRPGPIGLQVKAGDLEIRQSQLHARVSDQGAVDVTASGDGFSVTRRYRGSIAVMPSSNRSLTVSNTVPLEEYVAAVVGKEYGLEDTEGTKAMAVVARTFVLREMGRRGNAPGDGVSAQVYHGLDAATDATREAAEASRGQILTYEDGPIVAVYSASNGGHSASNSDVWAGEALPYLRSRRDRFDRAASPHNDWLSRLTRDRVHAALSDFLGATVTSIKVGDRSRDGRVRTVRVDLQDGPSQDVSGTDFRNLLAGRFGATTLRSTLFKITKEGDHYVFEGSGFGHGVGLSQWGAHEMANRGYNYEEILRFYYPGARLQTVADVGVPTWTGEVAADTSPRGDDDEVEAEDRDSRPTRYVRTGLKSWTASAERSGSSSTGRSRVGW